mgnify:CR=1 FL=1
MYSALAASIRWIAGSIGVGIVVVLLAGLWLRATTPDVRPLLYDAPLRTAYMRERATQLGLADSAFHTGTVPIQQMSPLLVCAVIKAEDRGFFRHHGFEWSAMRAALRRALQGNPSGGGSTLTQQLARNLYLSPDRSLPRKLREAIITFKLERTLPKQRIAELYLNSIEWGPGIWGASAATHHYLQEPPVEVDAFEASVLASLIAAPLQPYAGRNADRALHVQRRVLRQLAWSGVLSSAEARDAALRTRLFVRAVRSGEPFQAALHRARSARTRGWPSSPAAVPLSVSDVIQTGCGITREIGPP